MFPSLLLLPASFFKVLPLPQKVSLFRFHIPELVIGCVLIFVSEMQIMWGDMGKKLRDSHKILIG